MYSAFKIIINYTELKIKSFTCKQEFQFKVMKHLKSLDKTIPINAANDRVKLEPT